MLVELLEWLTGEGRKLIFTHLHADGPLAALHALAARDDFAETVFERRDLALEWCENRLLPGGAQGGGEHAGARQARGLRGAQRR
jgi:hypothetical protein